MSVSVVSSLHLEYAEAAGICLICSLVLQGVEDAGGHDNGLPSCRSKVDIRGSEQADWSPEGATNQAVVEVLGVDQRPRYRSQSNTAGGSATTVNTNE